MTARLMSSYYAATVLFLVLDFVFDVNIRLAFLDGQPGWRIAYYILCAAIFVLIVRYPQWGPWIGIGESLLTLSLLIVAMALRVLVVTDEMIETGRGHPTVSEIANFVIAALIVYVGYWQNAQAATAGMRRMSSKIK